MTSFHRHGNSGAAVRDSAVFTHCPDAVDGVRSRQEQKSWETVQLLSCHSCILLHLIMHRKSGRLSCELALVVLMPGLPWARRWAPLLNTQVLISEVHSDFPARLSSATSEQSQHLLLRSVLTWLWWQKVDEKGGGLSSNPFCP